MLEVLNRYANGCVLLSICNVLVKNGLDKYFAENQNASINKLIKQFHINSGPLVCAIRLLHILNMAEISDNGVNLRIKKDFFRFISYMPLKIDSLFDYNHFNVSALDIAISNVSDLDKNRDDQWYDMIIGPICSYLLLHYDKYVRHNKYITFSDWIKNIESESIKTNVNRFLENHCWLSNNNLTSQGESIVESRLNLGVLFSYYPMLSNLHSVFFGKYNKSFSQSAIEAEIHIDRQLNAIASGYQHKYYFESMEKIIVDIFDHEKYESQPKAIVDVGCGDGKLLKQLYLKIKNHTVRGKSLALHPVTLIGIDLNDASLSETIKTLSDLPHIVIKGDINNPDDISKSLYKHGFQNKDDLLYIRSFLDHEIDCQVNNVKLFNDEAVTLDCVSIDSEGEYISENLILEQYKKHFNRWCHVIGCHGLLVLEVHSLPIKLIRRYLSECENFYFDALQSLSKQHLLSADAFISCAASSGLLPSVTKSVYFPKLLPYTRISLNYFHASNFKIRQACLDDLANLVKLETACWDEHLRLPKKVIKQILARKNSTTYVLIKYNRIISVLYTQRISDKTNLSEMKHKNLLKAYHQDGEWLQLISLNALPDNQCIGSGEKLLSHVIHLATVIDDISKVIGVTRCKDFKPTLNMKYKDYIDSCKSNSNLTDSILNFHLNNGAILHHIISNYRPEDIENSGNGILIEYNIERKILDLLSTDKISNKKSKSYDSRSILLNLISEILGGNKSDYPLDKSFRDLGFNSLGLMTLRKLIEVEFSINCDVYDFFRYNTINKLSGYIDKTNQVSENLLNKKIETKATDIYSENDIAVIGLGFQLPENITTLESLWGMLLNSDNVFSPIPDDRKLTIKKDIPDCINWGGFFNNVSHFDAGFFNISADEANLMDPQQRILLETVWHALEDAAIIPENLRQEKCGVFIGTFGNDYEKILSKANLNQEVDPYYSTGTAKSILAGRIAYHYDLTGPAITIDTACSSSLMALHIASQQLRLGECNIALAGGVNLILSDDTSLSFAKAGMLSMTGNCHPFDEDANGYVRSEGCGIAVLKRYADAKADGDNILAVINSSASNQDGFSNGITAPNPESQSRLVQRVCELANIKSNSISYVEAHATGTPLGDPIEIQSIIEGLGNQSHQKYPIYVGSVKSHIGHTEACAGFFGLLKAILVLKNKAVPANCHREKINLLIKPLLKKNNYIIADELQQLTQLRQSPYALINSYGFSGSNVSMILSTPDLPHENNVPLKAGLLCISAKSKSALHDYISNYSDFLSSEIDNINFYQLCNASRTARQHFQHRVALLASDAREMLSQLKSYKSNNNNSYKPCVALIFSGQSAQYPGMGKVLYTTFPYFKNELDDAANEVNQYLQIDIREVIWGNLTSQLDDTQYTQPALFVLQYAIARLWIEAGIPINTVLGHSIGEIAAACIAKIISLPDAAKLVTLRGQIMQKHCSRESGMLVIFANEEKVRELIDELEELTNHIDIAVKNTLHNIVVSGLISDLDIFQRNLDQHQVPYQRLAVSHAFHSILMKPMIDHFKTACKDLQYDSMQCQFISTLYGNYLDNDKISNIDYWIKHILSPVLYQDAATKLLNSNVSYVIEVGPSATLINITKSIMKDSGIDRPIMFFPSINISDPVDSIYKILGEMYSQGINIKFDLFENAIRHTKIPRYPFQKDEYWFDANKYRNFSSCTTDLDIIGAESPNDKISDLGLSSIAVHTAHFKLIEKYGDFPIGWFYSDHTVESLILAIQDRHVESISHFSTPFVADNAEPIVISGMAGRFPGAKNIYEFENNLINSHDSIVEIPISRWQQSTLRDYQAPIKGGFIDNIEYFDAQYFSITPKEAVFMDPQERLTLEVATECLEASGFNPERIKSFQQQGNRVGVFVGATFNNYQLLQSVSQSTAINSQTYSIANRISYAHDLNGPSIVVDTACSSSLYALHLAKQSIQKGECSIAIVAGINLNLHPSKYHMLMEHGFLSKLGHCDAFGESADGYVPGEAVTAIILCKKDIAEKYNLPQLASILGTGVSHGGKASSYTAPKIEAQVQCIQYALSDAHLSKQKISYIETHGTGTKLGDPIEIEAISQAYKNNLTADCQIGSVKTNIGHSEAAAGIVQVIKVVLQLMRKQILPSLTFSENPNPYCKLADLGLSLCTSLKSWDIETKIAGVSSFGAGGVNVHAIVSELEKESRGLSQDSNPEIFCFSAQSPDLLRQYISDIAAYIELKEYSSQQVAAALNNQSIQKVKLAIVACSLNELQNKLTLWLSNQLSGSEYFYIEDVMTRYEDAALCQLLITNNMHSKLALLWTKGLEINYADNQIQPIMLPPRPFQSKRFWPGNSYMVHEIQISNKQVSQIPKDFDNDVSNVKFVVIQAIARATGFEIDDIDITCGFFQMDITSVMLADIVANINLKLGVEINEIDLFNYQTVEKLVDFISGKIQSDDAIPTIKTIETNLDKIAIVGISCRFSEDCDSLEKFWEHIKNNTEISKKYPLSRIDETGIQLSYPAGYLRHVSLFDPLYFGLSPKEASDMDPQQRILLELTHEAIQSAGYEPKLLDKSTAVYIGSVSSDFNSLLDQFNIKTSYSLTGTLPSIISGRISHIQDYESEAITVDTACSSSLVALHQACQSLKSMQCNTAIVGAANIILDENVFSELETMGALSTDGRCKTLSAAADGYGRAEGGAVILLKRLDDAKRDNDKIYAVVDATSVNHDGHSSGLTVPNGMAQQKLISQTLQLANASARDIAYYELHGTGTPLGDPLEIASIQTALQLSNQEDNYKLKIGSVKSLIGHTEACAGLAGLIKATMMIHSNKITSVKPVNFELNPRVSLGQHLEIPEETTDFDFTDKKIAVNSFGFSGTNACVILSKPETTKLSYSKSKHIFCISAKSKTSLMNYIQSYIGYIQRHNKLSLADICFTTNVSRSFDKYRFVALVGCIEELISVLYSYTEDLCICAEKNRKKSEANNLEEYFAILLTGSYVDWSLYYKGKNYTRVALPAYPFERKNYWPSFNDYKMHNQFPVIITLPSGDIHCDFHNMVFENSSIKSTYNIVHIGIYIYMLSLCYQEKPIEVHALEFISPMFGDSEKTQLSIIDSIISFKSKKLDSPWQDNVNGMLKIAAAKKARKLDIRDEVLYLSGRDFYQYLEEKIHVALGESVKKIENIYKIAENVFMADISNRDVKPYSATVLDCCAQLAHVVSYELKNTNSYMVSKIERVYINPKWEDDSKLDCELIIMEINNESLIVEFNLLKKNGTIIVEAIGVELKKIDLSILSKITNENQQLDKMENIHLLIDLIKQELVSVLGLEPETKIDEDIPLINYGLDSISAMQLLAVIQPYITNALQSHDLLTESTTIKYLSNHLDLKLRNNTNTKESKCLNGSLIKPNANAILYAIPYGGAGVNVFSALSNNMPDNIHFEPILLPGREQRIDEPLVQDINIIINEIATAISQHADRPFFIYGHSFGALLASQVMLKLQKSNHAKGLILSAFSAPSRDGNPWIKKIIKEINHKLNVSLDDLITRPNEITKTVQSELIKILKLDTFNNVPSIAYTQLLNILLSDLHLITTFKYSPFVIETEVLLMHGNSDDRVAESEMSHWREFCAGPTEFKKYDSDHFFVRYENIAALVAGDINLFIESRLILEENICEH